MDARAFFPKREPGLIHHRPRARQINCFTGLKFGTITPTDLDGLIDYHNERFAFLELKLRDAPVAEAQAKAFTRVVDAIEIAKKQACFFVAEHTTDDPMVDVPADRCLVRCFYTHQKWHRVVDDITLLAALNRFLEFSTDRIACTILTFEEACRGRPLQEDLSVTQAKSPIARAPSVDEIFRSSGGFK